MRALDELKGNGISAASLTPLQGEAARMEAEILLREAEAGGRGRASKSQPPSLCADLQMTTSLAGLSFELASSGRSKRLLASMPP